MFILEQALGLLQHKPGEWLIEKPKDYVKPIKIIHKTLDITFSILKINASKNWGTLEFSTSTGNHVLNGSNLSPTEHARLAEALILYLRDYSEEHSKEFQEFKEIQLHDIITRAKIEAIAKKAKKPTLTKLKKSKKSAKIELITSDLINSEDHILPELVVPHKETKKQIKKSFVSTNIDDLQHNLEELHIHEEVVDIKVETTESPKKSPKKPKK